jgi:hypothetical protein
LYTSVARTQGSSDSCTLPRRAQLLPAAPLAPHWAEGEDVSEKQAELIQFLLQRLRHVSRELMWSKARGGRRGVRPEQLSRTSSEVAETGCALRSYGETKPVLRLRSIHPALDEPI